MLSVSLDCPLMISPSVYSLTFIYYTTTEGRSSGRYAGECH